MASSPVEKKTWYGPRPGAPVLSAKVKFGSITNIFQQSSVSLHDTQAALEAMTDEGRFRSFAGRAILDFKIKGESSLRLEPPFDVLNPLVAALVDTAARSLDVDEELALIQLLVNQFKTGGNEVKPHHHRCRQVCLSLGSQRTLEVEGQAMTMRHGDVLPLAGEMHSVPPAPPNTGTRVSICLFYGSKKEYDAGSISVNASCGKFGDGIWWYHPQDLAGSASGMGKSGSVSSSGGDRPKNGYYDKSARRWWTDSNNVVARNRAKGGGSGLNGNCGGATQSQLRDPPREIASTPGATAAISAADDSRPTATNVVNRRGGGASDATHGGQSHERKGETFYSTARCKDAGGGGGGGAGNLCADPSHGDRTNGNVGGGDTTLTSGASCRVSFTGSMGAHTHHTNGDASVSGDASRSRGSVDGGRGSDRNTHSNEREWKGTSHHASGGGWYSGGSRGVSSGDCRGSMGAHAHHTNGDARGSERDTYSDEREWKGTGHHTSGGGRLSGGSRGVSSGDCRGSMGAHTHHTNGWQCRRS
eukprot:TRINITY_DN4432_c0_g1_i1.p1 TRINITY_DN4432_c0_g1~~TRINITY_DN4432_c0_g1_i1.p1  ORF type:complete len:581 (-),score=87.77 TRINITY_DN4432_c0_g1_i1:67-1659(-)